MPASRKRPDRSQRPRKRPARRPSSAPSSSGPSSSGPSSPRRASAPVSSPAELAATVPYQLGFHPTRSLVLVCLDGPQICLIARVDALAAPQATELARQLMEPVRRANPSAVCLVGFEEEAGESRAVAQAVRAQVVRDRIPVAVDVVVRDGRCLCEPECRCAVPCPEGGVPLPAAEDVPVIADLVVAGRSALPDRSALAALVRPLAGGAEEEVAAQVRSWRRRYDLARVAQVLRESEIDPDDSPDERLDERLDDWSDEGLDERLDDWLDEVGDNCADELLTRLLGTLADGRLGSGPDRRGGTSTADGLLAESAAAWRRLAHDHLDDEQLQGLVPALVGPFSDLTFRDAVVAWLSPGSGVEDLPVVVPLIALLEGGPDAGATPQGPSRANAAEPESQALQASLERLCRATPTEFAPEVLAVAGSYAWWAGDGSKALVCIEQALRIEPGHRLCQLIAHGLAHGVSPRVA